MKIFLDVGAHLGETVSEITDPRYGFDKIYCFEPAPACWPQIEAAGDERLELCRFGLWHQTCRRALYAAGDSGASIFEDAETIGPSPLVATVNLVRARDWMSAHTRPGDIIFAKLNCEGAECDIVEDLLDAGLLSQIYSLMIAFDVRNVPSLRWRERALRDRLREQRLANVCFSDDVMLGATHRLRIRHWLTQVGAEECLPLVELRARYAPTLARLASRRGHRARLEEVLRRTIWARLPTPLRALTKGGWRAIFPPRERRSD